MVQEMIHRLRIETGGGLDVGMEEKDRSWAVDVYLYVVTLFLSFVLKAISRCFDEIWH